MALKGGASEEELQPLIEHCVLCGACGAVCPMGVDTIGLTIGIRSGLEMNDPSRKGLSRAGTGSGALFMPGTALRANAGVLQRTLSLLNGYALTEDDAEPLVAALEGGARVPQSEAASYMRRLRERAGRIIVAEGLLHRLFRQFLGAENVIGLGEALLSNERMRRWLRPSDMYIIDSRAFHADFTRLIELYDRVRRERGLMMNLDLQRAATSPGATSGVHGVDPEAQARWIMNGRKAERVVVERVEDIAIFKAITDVPVLHLSQAGNDDE